MSMAADMYTDPGMNTKVTQIKDGDQYILVRCNINPKAAKKC